MTAWDFRIPPVLMRNLSFLNCVTLEHKRLPNSAWHKADGVYGRTFSANAASFALAVAEFSDKIPQNEQFKVTSLYIHKYSSRPRFKVHAQHENEATRSTEVFNF